MPNKSHSLIGTVDGGSYWLFWDSRLLINNVGMSEEVCIHEANK